MTLFFSEMRKLFHHPLKGKEASNRLLSLRQGSAPGSNYAIDLFFFFFLKGLADNIKPARDETKSLDELISLAIRLDNWL